MRPFLPLLLCLTAACGKTAAPQADASDAAADVDQVPVVADPDCNPIVGNDCWSGWPSNFWAKDDAGTLTKLRLDLPATKMPVNSDNKPVDVAEWNKRDGFSPNSPIVILLPLPPTPSALPDETRPALTFSADLPIVLVDANGQFIPFMAELDENADKPERTALIIRLWTPVPAGTKVIVALTDKLVDASGKAYTPTPTFQRILDGKATGYPRIDAHLADWQADLTTLAGAGLDKSHVFAAWHYQTATLDWTSTPTLAMRDALVTAVGDKGLDYHIDMVETATATAALFPNLPSPSVDSRVVIQEMHPDVALRVRGTFTAPLYLTSEGPEGTLNWQGDPPKIVQNGTVQRPFILLVPPNVLASHKPSRLMLYGHGFLRGACKEGCVEPGDAEFFPHFVHAAGVIGIGTDWWGLAFTELPLAVQAGNDFSLITRITDKLAVGAVMPIALTRMALGTLVNDPWLQFDPDKKPLYDKTQPPVYYGNSLGGIMGTTMSSLHPDLTRMVMNVAGGGWSTLLNRSSDFAPFLGIIDGVYPDKFNQQLLFAMSQTMWDLSDPFNFVGHVIKAPFPGVQAGRKALWPVSMGDGQVANLASQMMNRLAQVPLSLPSVEAWPLNLTTTDMPMDGNVAVQWDSERGSYPPGNATRQVENNAHYATRWMPEFEQMIWRFLFDDGKVEERYCLLGGRDEDGKLPCNLKEVVPITYDQSPPLPVIPPPVVQ